MIQRRMPLQSVEQAFPETILDEDRALRAIVEGVEAETGERFFRSLVRHVSDALAVEYAFVSELSEDRQRFRTLAVWGHGELLENFELPVAGTPCESVLRGEMAHHAESVQQLFPEDKGLVGWRAESYCGVPLLDAERNVLGHLAIFDTKPMRDPRGLSILRIFAARARAEVERKRNEQTLRASEVLFRDLYEAAPVAYITIGVDGRIRNLNERTLRVFGYTREQSIGRSFFDFLPDPSRQRAGDLFRRALGGEDIDEEEVEAERAGGMRFWIRVSARAVRGPAGDIRAFRTTFVDVTERKRAEEALRASEERLAQIVDTAPDAIIVIDDDGIIRLFNPAAEKVFRCAAADAIGTAVTRFGTASSAQSLAAAAADIRAGRKPFSISEPGLKSRRADGEEFEFEGTLSCAQVSGRRLWTIAVRDLEERRRAEAEQNRLRLQSAYLQDEIKAAHNFEAIIGDSRALADVLEKVDLVGATDSSVLVVGETGSGKELIARAVHARSRRRERPLIKLNCAALPTSLIESELFGHERGAFTGAIERRIGRFELADGGTIFLDEIGEIPLEVQTKLLRVLQERELERVGGTKTIRVDVRLIAATNRDLAAAVAAGTFRQDLYFRLNVFPIEVPPLRERREDIPVLARHFVGRFASKVGRRITRIPDDVMRRLVAYDWPGNIRELENVIERAVILSAGPELDGVGELAAQRVSPAPATSKLEGPVDRAPAGLPLEEVERRHILDVLKRSGWRIDGSRGAASILRVNPSTLRSRMKKLGIRRSHDQA
jgi:formate hydrogenlyase transcriptional activator